VWNEFLYGYLMYRWHTVLCAWVRQRVVLLPASLPSLKYRTGIPFTGNKY
jgi:hypothetical protein